MSASGEAPTFDRNAQIRTVREQVAEIVDRLDENDGSINDVSAYFIRSLLLFLQRRPKTIDIDDHESKVATALDFSSTGEISLHFCYIQPRRGESPVFDCEPEPQSLRFIIYITHDIHFVPQHRERQSRLYTKCPHCSGMPPGATSPSSIRSSSSRISPRQRVPLKRPFSRTGLLRGPPWIPNPRQDGSDCSTCASTRSGSIDHRSNRNTSPVSSKSRRDSMIYVRRDRVATSESTDTEVPPPLSMEHDWPVSHTTYFSLLSVSPIFR